MKRSSDNHENLDVELNIVPIIDCFVMLICFLLFTAAFIQLVYLEAKLTSNTAAAAQKSRADLDNFRLIVKMEEAGFKVTATGNLALSIPASSIPKVGNGDFDYKALHEKIITLKTAFPDRFSADIEFASNDKESKISYEKIIKTIDSIRHLSDDEFGQLRIAQKKLRNIEISSQEQEKAVNDSLVKLATSQQTNELAKNVDQKVLFPDVALVGMD